MIPRARLHSVCSPSPSVRPILPAGAHGPVPVVVELSGAYPPAPPRAPRPASAVAPTPAAVPPRPPAPDPGPPIKQQVLAKGWGYALLYHNSYQADNRSEEHT